MSGIGVTVVPSLFQSSKPLVPSSALKKMLSLKGVKPEGLELPAPGRIPSLTGIGVADVPSLFQSSLPLVPSLAWKKSVPLKLVSSDGRVPAPGLMPSASGTGLTVV